MGSKLLKGNDSSHHLSPILDLNFQIKKLKHKSRSEMGLLNTLQATTIFAVPNTSTAKKPLPTSPPPRALPPPPPTLTTPPVSSPTCSAKEWDIDSTRVLDVSMMLDGNYNATADPEWLEIGSRMRSCYRDDCSVLE